MRLPRLKLWALLVVVAVLAPPMWVVRWALARARYREEAAIHSRLSEECAGTGRYIDPRRAYYSALKPDSAAQLWGEVVVERDGTVVIRRDGQNLKRITDVAERAALAARYEAYATEHGRLRLAYGLAARYPWYPAPREMLPHRVPHADVPLEF